MSTSWKTLSEQPDEILMTVCGNLYFHEICWLRCVSTTFKQRLPDPKSLPTLFPSTFALLKEQRRVKRINKRSIRELDRELRRVKRQQKKYQNEMRRLAKQGQLQAVKHLAKDIVRMKDSETKFIKLQAEIRSLSATMDSMAATAQLQKAMKNVSRSLGTLSNQIRVPELQAALQKYQTESEQVVVMGRDMIDESVDDALDADSDVEDELVQKVLDEAGLNLAVGDLAEDRVVEVVEDHVVCCCCDEREDLQKRLNNLKR